MTRSIRSVAVFAWCAALGAALSAGAVSRAAPAPEPPVSTSRVLTVEVEGAITGGTAEYLASALSRAKAEEFDALAITLDTPGGELEATREIVRALLAAEVPTIVWVGPAGARAGSAGVFLTIAADVAAMHPTSNIGAAHPVTGGGRDVEAEAGKDMAKKVENDTAAFARSVAAAKGRNADWAEKAVRESVSVVASEAVKLRVVDLTATDLPEVLAKVGGKTVKTGAGPRRVPGAGAALVPHEQTVRQRILSFLGDPNVLAILMLLGTLGIAIEFYNPGAVLPGVVGATALFLAFLGSQIIPVNVGAMILVIVGVGLLVAEAYVTTHGIAGLGGAAAIVLGMLFFVDRASPDFRFAPDAFTLSPWVIWPTPIALAVLLGFMAWKVTSARRGPLQLGAPALVGAGGEALSEIGPAVGEAFVHGEYWQARSDAPIPRGARVRVVDVEGLVVRVVAETARTG